jgi:hypothetical protein
VSDQPPAKRPRCKVCHGLGYVRCDCWPGDCICGWGDEECEAYEGTGRILPDDYHGYEWEGHDA